MPDEEMTGEMIIVISEIEADAMIIKEVETVLDVIEKKKEADQELREENEKVYRRVQKNRQVRKGLDDPELRTDQKV